MARWPVARAWCAPGGPGTPGPRWPTALRRAVWRKRVPCPWCRAAGRSAVALRPHRAQGDDRVWMGVVDMVERQHAVQRCFDRRPRLTWLEDRVLVVADELFIGHGLPLDERHDVVQPQAGELLGADRGQVGA